MALHDFDLNLVLRWSAAAAVKRERGVGGVKELASESYAPPPP